MNPNTGEIYALANYPTYNPSEPPKPGEDPLARMDLGVQVPFEPGSIFKIMTVSAALETTNLTPDSPINCMGGVLHLPGRVIHDSHGGLGIISVREVIEHSSNIGAIQIGTRVGREKMYEYVRRFGFGAPTGVPLPAESGGRLRKLEKLGHHIARFGLHGTGSQCHIDSVSARLFGDRQRRHPGPAQADFKTRECSGTHGARQAHHQAPDRHNGALYHGGRGTAGHGQKYC